MEESVIGIIAIPGMMTGALLGGSSVEQAAKLQSKLKLLSRRDALSLPKVIIMFCISASTAFGTIIAVILCLAILVDTDHRVRGERLDTKKHTVWKRRDEILESVREVVVEIWSKGQWQGKSRQTERDPIELQQGLLR